MRAIAAFLVTILLASCATTRGDDGMASLVEGTLVVGGAAAATYDCVSDRECRSDLKWIGAGAAVGLAALLGASHLIGEHERHEIEPVAVHVKAWPRAGDVAFAFAIGEDAPDPAIGEHGFLGAVPIDPATQTADLTVPRRERVCVAYATSVDAPIEEAHCAPVRPILLFAPVPASIRRT